MGNLKPVVLPMVTWQARSLAHFLGEMKRRRVFPVLATYAIASWLLLQIAEVTFEPLGFPPWAMPLLIVIVITGFPIVFVLSWIFDLTPVGIVRDRHLRLRAGSSLRPSVAVLPFVDMSPDQDQGHFCEGVAEEIINALTRLPKLNVAARSSSFQYRDLAGDVREIGQELGVSTILEGSVRKSDGRIRVNAQLIDARDGYHLWSAEFNEELKDVFAIQDEIANAIADCLLQRLEPHRQAAIRTTSSKDVGAYDFYLRGRQFINRFSKIDMECARQMFFQAISIDPEFALAWAGYADCHSLLVMYSDHNPRYVREADKASLRALELAPELAEAHVSRGLALLVASRFDDAETEFRFAIARNPKLYEAYYYYGRARFHEGDPAAAAELFRQAFELNPADYQARCLRIQILRGSGRLEEARDEARQAVEAIERHLRWNPDDARAFHLGAGSLIVLGETDRAKRWLRRALEIDPNDSVLLYNVACNYATLGETQTALDYLEQAVTHGMVSLDWMENDEDLEPLRVEPRYQALVARLGSVTDESHDDSTTQDREPARNIEQTRQ